jgi:hypothetical protein
MKIKQILSRGLEKYAEPVVQPTAGTQPIKPLGGAPAGAGNNAASLPPSSPAAQLTSSDWTKFYSSPEGRVPGMKFVPQSDGTMSFDVSGGPKQINSTPTPAGQPVAPPAAPTLPAPVATPVPPAPASAPAPTPAPTAPVPNIMKPPQAPTTPVPTQPANQAPQTSPANDKMPKLIEHAQATLAAAKTPEAKAEVEKQLVPNVTAQIKETATPETVDIANRAMQGDAEAVATGRDNFITDQAGGDPTKTQDPTWYGQAMGMWDGLGPTGQAAFMVGVPAALISLLSGDGLMGILGGLGIGALGVGAGAMGMLGENTQAGMGRMLGDAANFFNVIPDEARDSKMFAPGADAAVKQKIQDAIKKAPQGQGAVVGQQLLDAERAKFDQLRQLHAINPELANSYLMGMTGEYAPKTREEAAALFSRLQQQYDETGQKGYLYNQALQAAQKERDAKLQEAINGGGITGLGLGIGKYFGVDPNAAADAAMHARLAERGFFPPTEEEGRETRASMNIAQKIVLKHAALKAARCWAGYEPVPGKEPYSNNSCRPAGSKSKKKKTEKKAAGMGNPPKPMMMPHAAGPGSVPPTQWPQVKGPDGQVVYKNPNAPAPLPPMPPKPQPTRQSIIANDPKIQEMRAMTAKIKAQNAQPAPVSRVYLK